MQKKLSEGLTAVIEKYRSHPQFLGIEIVDPNQSGALDDRLLHLAASRGVVGDIEVLVSAGAEIDAPGDLGYTPLHNAVMSGKTEAIRKLLELGADLKIKNEFGEDAMQIAQNGGHEDVIRILRRHLDSENT